MNRRILLLLAASLIPAGAQQIANVSGQPEHPPALYEFKHLDPQTAGSVSQLAMELFRVNVRYDGKLNMAVIRAVGRAAQDEQVKAVDFLKKYDVPPPAAPQVHYQAYLIRASRRSTALPNVNPIPKELDDAITEMKHSLVYSRYDLITAVSSVSEGAASASDVMFNADESMPHFYSIEYGSAAVAPDRKSVSIRPFTFILRGPSGDKNSVLASISSDVTVHDGQKLVLGKVRVSNDADIFVVLTAKVE